MVGTCGQAVVFLSSSVSYVRFDAQPRAQVAIGHVGRDDERRLVAIEADTDERQNVGMFELGHDESLVQELLFAVH